jgi:hypothetical protein
METANKDRKKLFVLCSLGYNETKHYIELFDTKEFKVINKSSKDDYYAKIQLIIDADYVAIMKDAYYNEETRKLLLVITETNKPILSRMMFEEDQVNTFMLLVNKNNSKTFTNLAQVKIEKVANFYEKHILKLDENGNPTEASLKETNDFYEKQILNLGENGKNNDN